MDIPHDYEFSNPWNFHYIISVVIHSIDNASVCLSVLRAEAIILFKGLAMVAMPTSTLPWVTSHVATRPVLLFKSVTFRDQLQSYANTHGCVNMIFKCVMRLHIHTVC